MKESVTQILETWDSHTEKVVEISTRLISELTGICLKSYPSSCSWCISREKLKFTQIELFQGQTEILFVELIDDWLDDNEYCEMIIRQSKYKLKQYFEDKEQLNTAEKQRMDAEYESYKSTKQNKR